MPPAVSALVAARPGAAAGGRARNRGRVAAVTLVAGMLFALVTAVVVSTGHLGPFDGWVLDAYAPVPRSGLILSLVQAACLTASAAVGVAVLMVVGSVLTVRQRTLVPLATSTFAVGLLVVSVYVLKWAVGRARPPLEAAVDPEPGFPSGHTTTAVVMVGVLLLLVAHGWPTARRWIAWLAAAVFALGIAMARLYLGVHWFSDVLGGLLLGTTIVGSVAALVPLGVTRLDRVGSRLWPS